MTIAKKEPLFVRHERARRVVRLREAGVSLIEIARREGLPVQAVREILESQ